MDKKVALITIFDIPNYGSVLQAFATQKIIKNQGFGCELIDYKYPNDWHFKNGMPKTKLYIKIRSRIANLLGYKTPTVLLKEGIHNFIAKRLDVSEHKFISFEDLENCDWTKFAAVIAGSDQVWNPKFMLGDKAYLLSFVLDEVPKFSIASSFACNELPKKYVDSYYSALSRFFAISVRDSNGLKILGDLGLKVPCTIIPDPTLLLSDDEWRKELGLGASSEDHILVYNLRYAVKAEPYIYDVVAEMQHRLNLPVVFIGKNNESQIKEKNIKSYKILEAIEVEDFVSLFNSANTVITSSFHGTAFALNFSKPLIAIVPENGDDRQRSILKMLGVEHCAVEFGTPIKSIHPEYDKDILLYNLDSMRNESINWIGKCLMYSQSY